MPLTVGELRRILKRADKDALVYLAVRTGGVQFPAKEASVDSVIMMPSYVSIQGNAIEK